MSFHEVSMNDYFDIKQAARKLNLHPETIRDHCRAGNIAFGRVGTRYRFSNEHLEAFVSKHGSPARRTLAKIYKRRKHVRS